MKGRSLMAWRTFRSSITAFTMLAAFIISLFSVFIAYNEPG